MSYTKKKNKAKDRLLERRVKFFRQLSLEQNEALYSHRKWLWISKFHTNIINNTQWLFAGYTEDLNFDIHLGNKNTLHCDCGHAVKYLYEIKRIDEKKSKFLGINHLEQHLKISELAVDEIKDKNKKIQKDLDDLILRYFSGQNFPYKLYKNYKDLKCVSNPPTFFDQKLEDFSKGNFPLKKKEKLCMKKSIIGTLEKNILFQGNEKVVSVLELSQRTGIQKKDIMKITKKQGDSYSSLLTQDEVKVFLNKVNFNDIELLIPDTEMGESVNDIKLITTYFDFPRPPFNIRDKDFVIDIVYETVQWEGRVKKSNLIKEIEDFYILNEEIEEFEELVNINQIIDGLILDGDIYCDDEYLLYEQPISLQENEFPLLKGFYENKEESIKDYVGEYVAIFPAHRDWLGDNHYMTGYILNVIIEESPIHKKFLKKRLEMIMEEEFNGEQFKTCVQKLINSSAIIQKDKFLYVRDSKVNSIRKNSKYKFNCRKSNYVSIEELELAVHLLTIKNDPIEFEHLIKSMQSIFNISNFSDKTIKRIRNLVDK
ncbi:hypothetical protein [Lactococcus kimchii]|uniref:hypothetical protein n=1 Tax=Lactococcus sp. S-13 TaxID=2507158 RepID=UPI0010236BB0|nr:hypothetical protein [Lactococcus sp. S-13]RZI49017.1 hypothetical protein EQJ87_05925 [Lactococcus sp. S-13]